MLRSNNGKEYTSNQFNQFYEEVGIEHQLTTPYTLQQNGVSERKNRIIFQMARCMMHEKDLPKENQPEATNTAMFLLNIWLFVLYSCATDQEGQARQEG